MKKIFILILVLVGIAFIASFFVKKNYQVITADLDEKGFFPKDCYVFYQEFHYRIDRKLVYKNQLLAKDISSGSESIIVRNIDFYDLMKKNMKGYKFLDLKNIDSNKIKYNSKIYTVESKIGDSIFCRIDKDKIIVFIEKENLD
ncbi:hypothetical protein [Cloacibacterium sp.]|uniref:hypothetical protein n=1 Tax=Cloacibacterium sp. TaxID=1913682 RepID=UPI0039E4350B